MPPGLTGEGTCENTNKYSSGQVLLIWLLFGASGNTIIVLQQVEKIFPTYAAAKRAVNPAHFYFPTGVDQIQDDG